MVQKSSRNRTPTMSRAVPQARIVVADAESPWRATVVGALAEVEPAIRVTENGNEVCRALEEVANPPKIIVLGQALKGIGGLEALHQAERTLAFEKKERPTWPTRTV